MSIFKGAGVALITPMNEDETINYDKLSELIEYHIANKTDAIIIAGTTGESACLSMEEHKEIIERSVEMAKGRIPIIAGTGSNSTKTAIQLSKEAEEAGVDGLLLVTPYYNKATQKGLVAHYSAIADETKLPIILYNVPSRTGTNIAPETVATLIKTKENIVALKDATGNMAQSVKTMDLCDGKLDMYSGEDGLVVPLMSIGALGVISVWSNVAPQDVHDMCSFALDGDFRKATEIQLKGRALVDALFSEVNPIPVKAAMDMLGFNVGPLRAPLYAMSDENAAALKDAMIRYGLNVK